MELVQAYLQNTTIPFDDTKLITHGPFFKAEYQTIKFIIRAPQTAKVDVDSYSIIVAVKNKKIKVQPIIKEASYSYLKEFQKLVENIAKQTSVNNLLIQVSINFDQFLLKLWSYFTRYQAIDETGCTCLRYLFKQECEIVNTLPEATKIQLPIESPQSQVCQVETLAEQADTQVEKIEEPKVVTQLTNQVQQVHVQFRYKTEQELKNEEFKKLQMKQRMKIYDESEIITLDQFHAQIAQQKSFQQQRNLQQKPKIDGQEVLPKDISQNETWNTIQSVTYRDILVNLKQNQMTKDMLVLSRRYDGFNIHQNTESEIIFSFNVPLKQIPFAASKLLPVFSTLFSENDVDVTFLIAINLITEKKSFIRVDPQGKLLHILTKQARQLPPELMLSIDYCDYQFLSILSREMSQILRSSDIDAGNNIKDLDRREDTLKQFNICMIRPPVYKYIRHAQVQQGQYSEQDFLTKINSLPSPQCYIPLIESGITLLKNFDIIIQLFSDISAFAALQIKRIRVQQYLEGEGEEFAISDEQDSDSYYESSFSSSESSIYDTYAQVTDSFLAINDPQLSPNSLRLSLTNLQLENSMIIQFQKVQISVMCSKCSKMSVLTLDSTAIYKEYKTLNSDILACKQLCQFCTVKHEISCVSKLFNQAFKGDSGHPEPLFIVSHVNCIPLVLSFMDDSVIIIQCQCGTLSVQNSVQFFVSHDIQGAKCRCPNCFKPLIFTFESSYFALQSGKQIPLPNFLQKPQKAQVFSGTGKKLPNNGTCEHYQKSFRWFRFACGQAFPCDVCHTKNCGCGDEIAKQMICGYCGKHQSVQSMCQGCRSDLTRARGCHWEGGNGCRNQEKMSKKDDKKYRGSWKSRSNKERKRMAMQKRGNAKKKDGERY
ncbi:CHY zinc finger domain-containing protein [Spironucleus salmonicida]|uniref:CHY zinc finger domain-containing protein n=3 Tax=Spironucleus salmonicida TaxID=348837 RepID=A0A9P8LVX6_9EUKA|nr:CHY zinc finger domain-containing protein [Spironucleus salmonicida]